MPSKKEKDAVASRLRALMNLIQQEAKDNPDFFERLQNILMSDEAIVALETKSTSRKRPPVLPILSILHKKGESALQADLEQLTNDKLARLAADEGIKKLGEAKETPRSELVGLLIETAKKRLKQGESFTR